MAAFAAAPITKYSFLLVFLMGAAVALASLLDKRIREDHGGALHLSRQLLILAVAVVMAALLAAWATFGFKTQEGESPDFSNPPPIEQLVPEESLRGLLCTIRSLGCAADSASHGSSSVTLGPPGPDDAGVPYVALPGVTCCWSPREWTLSLEPGDVVPVSVANLVGVYFRLPGPSAFPLRVSFNGVPQEMPFIEAMTYLQKHHRPFAPALATRFFSIGLCPQIASTCTN